MQVLLKEDRTARKTYEQWTHRCIDSVLLPDLPWIEPFNTSEAYDALGGTMFALIHHGFNAFRFAPILPSSHGQAAGSQAFIRRHQHYAAAVGCYEGARFLGPQSNSHYCSRNSVQHSDDIVKSVHFRANWLCHYHMWSVCRFDRACGAGNR